MDNAKSISVNVSEKSSEGNADKNSKNPEMALISFSTANKNAAEVSFVNET